MGTPGFNPQHDRPEPEYERGPEEDNLLDKSGLDINNEDALKSVLQEHKVAAMILHIARQPVAQSPAEATTPLQVFGVLAGSLRRKQEKSLEEVAARAALPPGDLFALELGELPLDRVLSVLPALGKALGGSALYLAQSLVELVLGE